MRIALEAVLLKLNAKLAPGWALIRVNFDPIQESGPKVGGGRPFVSGPFSVRLVMNLAVTTQLRVCVYCPNLLISFVLSACTHRGESNQ